MCYKLHPHFKVTYSVGKLLVRLKCMRCPKAFQEGHSVTQNTCVYFVYFCLFWSTIQLPRGLGVLIRELTPIEVPPELKKGELEIHFKGCFPQMACQLHLTWHLRITSHCRAYLLSSQYWCFWLRLWQWLPLFRPFCFPLCLLSEAFCVTYCLAMYFTIMQIKLIN